MSSTSKPESNSESRFSTLPLPHSHTSTLKENEEKSFQRRSLDRPTNSHSSSSSTSSAAASNNNSNNSFGRHSPTSSNTPVNSILSGERAYRRVNSSGDLPDAVVAPFQLKGKLFRAVKNGEYSMVWALLAKGADPSELEEGTSGLTPLHVSAKEGNLPITQLLASRGADVNVKDKSGQTPLHKAAYWGRYEIVDFLIFVGANFKLTDNLHQTPQEIAFHRNNMEVAELLKTAKESQKPRSKGLKQQFEQLMSEQAKEAKQLKKIRKLEEKLGEVSRDQRRLELMEKELGARGKTLGKREKEQLAALRAKSSNLTLTLRENTIAISTARAATFAALANEPLHTQSWMTFIQEL